MSSVATIDVEAAAIRHGVRPLESPLTSARSPAPLLGFGGRTTADAHEEERSFSFRMRPTDASVAAASKAAAAALSATSPNLPTVMSAMSVSEASLDRHDTQLTSVSNDAWAAVEQGPPASSSPAAGVSPQLHIRGRPPDAEATQPLPGDRHDVDCSSDIFEAEDGDQVSGMPKSGLQSFLPPKGRRLSTVASGPATDQDLDGNSEEEEGDYVDDDSPTVKGSASGRGRIGGASLARSTGSSNRSLRLSPRSDSGGRSAVRLSSKSLVHRVEAASASAERLSDTSSPAPADGVSQSGSNSGGSSKGISEDGRQGAASQGQPNVSEAAGSPSDVDAAVGLAPVVWGAVGADRGAPKQASIRGRVLFVSLSPRDRRLEPEPFTAGRPAATGISAGPSPYLRYGGNAMPLQACTDSASSALPTHTLSGAVGVTAQPSRSPSLRGHAPVIDLSTAPAIKGTIELLRR